VHLIHRHTSGRLPTSTFDLVDDAGNVVGFCQIRHCPSHRAGLPPEAGNHVYYEIAEHHRGRGYGEVLMRLALAEAKRIGLEKVRVLVDDDNPASRHIVEAIGAVRLRGFRGQDGTACHLFEVPVR
jgi:predicted acetyltransferase